MVVADEADPPAPTEAQAAPRQIGVVALVALAVIVVDQLSKSWAVSSLADGRIVKVVGSLQFRLAHNPGAAFSVGRGSNLGPIIAVLAVVVVVVLVTTGSTTRSRMGAVSVGLIAGGALGNIIDRSFRDGSGFLGGHVVDFIDAQWWPIFNVADMGVVIGAILLILFGLRAPTAGPSD